MKLLDYLQLVNDSFNDSKVRKLPLNEREKAKHEFLKSLLKKIKEGKLHLKRLNNRKDKKIRLSFDFDSTLSIKEIEVFAKELIEDGYEVWVITTRNHAFFAEVKDVTDRLKIPSHRVIFTSGKDKYKACEDLNISIHLDDDNHEIEVINAPPTKTLGIRCSYNPSWKNEYNEYLKTIKER